MFCAVYAWVIANFLPILIELHDIYYSYMQINNFNNNKNRRFVFIVCFSK